MDGHKNTTDLIPFATRQLGSETVPTVDARDLHDFLGPKSRFDTWIIRRIQQYGFQEDRDFTTLKIEHGTTSTQTEYHLTIGMAKELSMVERTKKGKEARQYFLACEAQLKSPPPSALDQFPEYRLAVQALEAAAQSRLIAEAAQADAAQSRLAAARAEGKADMALEEARTMTLEDFVLWNGLLRQLPESRWHEYARWLRDYCLAWGLDNGKSPVIGKVWKKENAYPVAALSALKRYEQTRPQQVTLLRDKKDTR